MHISFGTRLERHAGIDYSIGIDLGITIGMACYGGRGEVITVLATAL